MLLTATLRRAVASFFLIELLGSLAAPSLLWASSGPGQPEFTSYESAGSPDMVNLGTGDLTYNVPVLDVPGAETSFSLPLTYRAGIRPEQEASWVGLGWGMNPGAIVRNVNGYPDDASGELATNSYSDPGHRGWYGGVPGLLQLGWDSETGHSGSASLIGLVSASWSGGKLQSGDVIGIGASRSEGATFSPLTFVMGVATIATLGISSPITGTASLGVKAATQAGSAIASGVGMAAFGKQGPAGGGFNRPTVVKEHTWFRTNYWVFVNDTTKEAMFGSLYFNKMSSSIDTRFTPDVNANNYGPNVYDGQANYAAGKATKGYLFNYHHDFGGSVGNFSTETGADIQRYNQPYGPGYETDVRNPTSIAHDDFSVMGPGISGTIRPQRLDVGSFANPRQMLDRHDKYSLVPWEDYKVDFRYENGPSNTYDYSANTNASSALGIDASHWGESKLVLTDPKLFDRTQTSQAQRVEADRKGLTNGHLSQGKQIRWFSNKEIADAYDATPATQPIMEYKDDLRGTRDYQVIVDYLDVPGRNDDDPHTYEPVYETRTVTSENIFRRVHPENGIGAFAVTAEDGTTYHYSLPVYHYRQYSNTSQVVNGVDKGGLAIGRTGAAGAVNANYATAWLLTAITGPDFIDKGTVGVVDDQDLGTWVKFSYGKFSSQYKWRQPYVGKVESPAIQQVDGTKTSSRSYQEGAQETYYLNSVRTRTHTALFIKSPRQDGRGHYGATTTATTSNLGIDERTPASSLRLDEVMVISNKDLSDLQTATGFNENTTGNATTADTKLGTGDTFAEVYDAGDITPSIRKTLNQKVLKRVVFNYSYRLCPGAPNSFASPSTPPALGDTYSATGRLGKLTLESIATYGPNSVKIIPDFKFDYGFNPAYNPIKHDAYGMYSSVSSETYPWLSPSNDVAVASQDGAAWSLAKITNPLGSITEIKYERDQYARVSEFYTGSCTLTNQEDSDGTNGVLVGCGTAEFPFIFKPGSIIHLTGYSYEKYSITETPVDQNGRPDDYPNTYEGRCPSYFDDNFTIQSLDANSITLTSALPAPYANECVPNDTRDYHYTGADIGYGGCFATIEMPVNTTGGDIRVASISTRDENGQVYTVKYQYTVPGVATSNSSGVISKEPERIRSSNKDYKFYNLFDYPSTPIMYGQVTVLRGNFTTPDDIDLREEYSFYTAQSSMVSPVRTDDNSQAYYPFLSNSSFVNLRQQKNDVTVDIGLLGQAKSIKKYNRRGTLEFSTVFNYANSLPNADNVANQAVYSEGGLMSEFLQVNPDDDNHPTYNLNWTTKRYLPTVLRSITTTTNNVAATTTNNLYDFYTGAVLETKLTNSLGDTYRSRTIPAYTRYPGMGPKTEAPGNAHMLTQTAATYSYKDNGTSTPAVFGAGIQTWNNSWNYRLYDPTSDTYRPDPAAQVPVWRQHRTFAWQSPQLNTDGSYANFTAYDWSQPTPAKNWLNVGEVTLYDHFSRPLESKDVNGQFATQKAGYDQSQVLAAAHNARFTEIAYSGAEDPTTVAASVTHFGGEVRDGGQQSPAQKHTGLYSSLLTAANPLGFTYKAIVGDANDLSTDRTYRASVWVHASDAAGDGRLYLALNGTTVKEISKTDPSARRAGNWYQLNLAVPLPASATGQTLTVGCRNAGTGSVYVDDFRFQPLDAPLQATVYDPNTRQPTFTLDNDNLYTRYEYDAAGKVIRVYQEVLTPGATTAPAERLVKESSYNYAQLRAPNWLSEGTVCAKDPKSGKTTGYLAQQYRDVNTESPTYNQLRLDPTNELSPDCN